MECRNKKCNVDPRSFLISPPNDLCDICYKLKKESRNAKQNLSRISIKDAASKEKLAQGNEYMALLDQNALLQRKNAVLETHATSLRVYD